MSERATQVLEQALRLPVAERAAIVDELLTSLAPPDPRMDDLWAQEAEARLAAFDAGRIEAIPAEEVFADLEEL
jgi:putative addiction module component (TIGR02574 family)